MTSTGEPKPTTSGPGEDATSQRSVRSHSHSKSKSGRSNYSNSSSYMRELIDKKTNAEKAKVHIEYERKQVEMRKIQAQLEADQQKLQAEIKRKQLELKANIEFLNAERQLNMANAELKVFEQEIERSNSGSCDLFSNLDVEDPEKRTQQYVSEIASQHELQPSECSQHVTSVPISTQDQTTQPIMTASQPVAQQPSGSAPPNIQQLIPNTQQPAQPYVKPYSQPQPSMVDFTKFLLKKDIVKLRLSKFTDNPATYICWKSTFRGIMIELTVSAHEELDLLQQYLGPESGKYAANIRAANAYNPSRALEKIWQRLDDKYGRPEIVQSCLNAKLTAFPKVNVVRDPKRMFELADLLSEIESVKGNPDYGALFPYFDTTTGVNPVLNKLPHNIQEKWVSAAMKYKTTHGVVFPPFSYFVEFIHNLARVKNDPSFQYENTYTGSQTIFQRTEKVKPRDMHKSGDSVSALKTGVQQDVTDTISHTSTHNMCPIHGTNHSLNDCRVFRSKPLSERKQFLKEHGLCYKCCGTVKHLARDCRLTTVTCGICKSNTHPTGLHQDTHRQNATPSHGGEQVLDDNTSVQKPIVSKCTQICKDGFSGKSCAKIVLAKVYPEGQPERAVKIYCIIDDQSNKSLAKTEFFDIFNEKGSEFEYTLSSCSGSFMTSGRRASNYTIAALDGSTTLKLPTLVECNQIPDNRDEIPTPEVATAYPHLQDIESCIPPIDDSAHILLLLGRDIVNVHHVLDQRIGHSDLPYAQQLNLGWVIIGESCIGKVHKGDHVTVNKTFILRDGQSSLHPPCINNFRIKESNLDSIVCEPDTQLFISAKDDNKPGKSIEDSQFEKIMEDGMMKNDLGHWEAPLPFKPDRQPLPNNKPLALKRAKSLETSLLKDESKRKHFFEFMANTLDKGLDEEVAPLPESDECWYLPIFGVYHPQKPSQIRVVFDSSAQYQGISLNNVLLTGPNVTNDLLGILMRFRQGPIAATADIQQMFYGFYVQPSHRKYLRFLWYKDNDISKGLTEYQMNVHVFGNTTSPAIATYALRKCVENSDSSVKDFVTHNFYVDDALLSSQSVQEAVNLLKNTQQELLTNGNLKLHKIASSSVELMNKFPNKDLSKDIQNINFTEEYLPFHRSLGLSWNLNTDNFTFNIPHEHKPFTRRGILSMINSLYDPIGFIAPMIIKGKMLLREMSEGVNDWDQELNSSHWDEWTEWALTIQHLKEIKISRTYSPRPLSDAVKLEAHIFSDASEKAIGAVAYLKSFYSDGEVHIGFLLGKAKLAPLKGHSLPRLELCAAVLAVEVGETIQESLDIHTDRVIYYTDSQVVLGYLNNTTRKFYNYVSNRVERIRSCSKPSDWRYVNTKHNPADLATRSVHATKLQESMWLNGPIFLQDTDEVSSCDTVYPLLDPNHDKEIRPQVGVLKTTCDEKNTSLVDRFTKFSKWQNLVNTIARLKRFIRNFKARKEQMDITRSHLDEITKEAELYIIRETRKYFYPEDIKSLHVSGHVGKSCDLVKLNPFLDSKDVLRVGGRVRNSYLDKNESQPIILPGKSHIAKLIVTYYHQKVLHQGRLITEGSIRTNGYWITGCKRIVSSVIHHCVTCRKLRGKEQQQLMAELPSDRLTVGAPFLNVGLDVFGPWKIVTRKTRGGVISDKRWAVLFTCLSTRAVHIEVIEEMSSSSFINALNRFIAIRGDVKIIRSDRGTNFIGAANLLHLNCVNIEDASMKPVLSEKGITWIFNPPHSSHMGGVWERMIGTARRILDSLLVNSHMKNLTHEVLVTFMAEVSAVMNSRPITTISTDSEDPVVLSPALLLTHKDGRTPLQMHGTDLDVKDLYRAQWKRVQYLSEYFWQKWRKEYLQTLQTRRKWTTVTQNITEGSVVLLKEDNVPRRSWPLAKVSKVIPSKDGNIRKAVVLVYRDGKCVEYVRPITELILLVDG